MGRLSSHTLNYNSLILNQQFGYYWYSHTSRAWIPIEREREREKIT